MRNKITNILLGIILIAAGVVYIFRKDWGINFTSIIILLLGICFLLNYINKRSRFSIIPAVYLIFYGCVDLLLRDTAMYSACMSAVFYFSPGILFIIWYLRNKRSFYLTLGCLFNAVGVDLILYPFVNGSGLSLMLMCIGIGLLLSYVIYGNYTNKVKLYISLAIILLAAANLFDVRYYAAYAIPSVLIVIGFAIIVTTIKGGER